MDSVDYRCKFVLKNLTAKPVTIQVGFPVDSERVDKQPPATDVVLDYHFIARDEKTTYHVRFIPADSERKFSRLFLWDMTFQPTETKVLHVAYELGVSGGIGTTNRGGPTGKHEKGWHTALETTVFEYFTYVTETGKSWAGPIEHATFRVQASALEKCLDRKVLFNWELAEPKHDHKSWDDVFPLRTGSVYKAISPKGWKDSRGERIWEYTNYKPGAAIECVYFVVAIPRTAADCDSWVLHVLGKTPSKIDVAELREIAAAFFGIEPRGKSAKEFVERQRWYHPTKGLQESQLNEEQRAILTRLDAIAKKCDH